MINIISKLALTLVFALLAIASPYAQVAQFTNPIGLAPVSTSIPSATTPGGNTTAVQYNNGGAFAGNAGLTYISGTQTLSATTVSTSTLNGTAINGNTINANSSLITSGTVGNLFNTNFTGSSGSFNALTVTNAVTASTLNVGTVSASTVSATVANASGLTVANTVTASTFSGTTTSSTNINATTLTGSVLNIGTISTTGVVSFSATSTANSPHFVGSLSSGTGAAWYEALTASGAIIPNGTSGGLRFRALQSSTASGYQFQNSAGTAYASIYTNSAVPGLRLGDSAAPSSTLDVLGTARISSNTAIGSSVTPTIALEVYPTSTTLYAVSTTGIKFRPGTSGAQPYACNATNNGAMELTSSSLPCFCRGGTTTWQTSAGGACVW